MTPTSLLSLIPAPVAAAAPVDRARDLTDLPLSNLPALAGVAVWLRGVLQPVGVALPDGPAQLGSPALPSTGPSAQGLGGVTLGLDESRPREGYRLVVSDDEVSVVGGSAAGVFYGLQTLRQLLPPAFLRRALPAGAVPAVPHVEIEDAPRFRWRGVLLDVARHFMPVADVLRFIDLIAFHKLNVLHLHLTDDQGWRLEVPGWPRLTEVGAWRPRSMLGSSSHGRYDERPHGGYYLADDLREIVAYAAARHVTVVPEIDLPGHMQAAIAAYPELGNGATPAVRTAWGISTHLLNVSDTAVGFVRDVLTQVCSIFPSEIIGIGGDECPPGEWAESAAIQEFRRAHDLADERAVHAWWIGQAAAHLRTLGRRAYGWDEILDGGAPADAVVAAWRGPARTARAARAGHEVVACPDTAVYLDYRQSEDPGEPTPVGTVLPLSEVHAFDPVPPGLTEAEAARVIGAQANLWTEHMESSRRVDYMAFPRLAAFAEAVWHRGDDFGERLPVHAERLAALGVNYRPLSGPRPWDARPDALGRPRSRQDREAELSAMTAES
ncbi:beta-N-acetylhexosaminidase [Actinoplanes sp. NPDC049265]|uniref:beta-N-acetylhexosaminidase n=1 Tax=Actinoplanes sp. NPDC049265 TaxID=3363902 RepID=UPI00371949EE